MSEDREVPWPVELGIVLDTASALLLRIAKYGDSEQLVMGDSDLVALCEEANTLMFDIGRNLLRLFGTGNDDDVDASVTRIDAWRLKWAEFNDLPVEVLSKPTSHFLSREG